MSEESQADLFGPAPKLGARWGQERRFEFIDYRLRWDGQFNRSDLKNFFGISTPQASLDISEYTKRAPGNLEYDPKTKAYKAGSEFKSVYMSSRLERYLEDLLRSQDPSSTYGSFLRWAPDIGITPRPGRRLDSAVVISIVKAIREQNLIELQYQSFSSSEPQFRKLSPHALAYDGFRWHVRAFCHTRNAYRDFLLSRILKIEGTASDIDRGVNDVEWHTDVRLVLAPHPLLGESHQKVIELDYGMVDGACEFICKQALLFYVLRQLGLQKDVSALNPVSQHIILQNWDEVEGYLPQNSFR